MTFVNGNRVRECDPRPAKFLADDHQPADIPYSGSVRLAMRLK